MRMLLGLATLERSTLRFAFAMLILVGAAGTLTSCGGSSGMSKTLLSGNTQVTVELSSTANDQLQSFGLGFQSISLTSQSGKTVSLFSGTQGTEQWAEFIHVNGGAEPLLTLSVPQDIYTAATVQVADSGFTCVTLIPGGGTDTSTFAYGTNPNNSRATTVTVNLPSPITITGNNMGLMLDLLVTQSASYSSCYDASGTYTYAITPTFNLTPVTFSAQPTNAGNGKVLQLYGEITAVGTGSSFTLNLPDTKTLAVAASTSTTYQGISGFSALAAGAFLDMDGTIQPDGSLLATRIEVDDPTAVDVQTGPVMIVGGDPRNGETSTWAFNRLSQGADEIPNVWPYEVASATFKISGQLSNLQSLPFVPSFSAANVVAGQNVYISAQELTSTVSSYSLATTVTLMPQMMNGTIVGSSTSGNFTDYTISLASYDLFPTLAVQQGQTTLLTNPSEVEVYVDSNTQMLNTQSLTAGNTLRFYGLVFNDNGTLRMDCAQVQDGVTGSSQTNPSSRLEVEKSRTVLREGPGKRSEIFSTINRSH